MTTATLPLSRATVALQESPLPALRKLSIQETEAIVLIQGKVPSYYLKQMAQETVMPELAGRSLVNRVTVVRN
jgi:hypothetical protein